MPRRGVRPLSGMAALVSAAAGSKVHTPHLAAAGFFEDDKDLDFYDFEPLPTLPEDEVRRRGTPPSLA